MSRLLVSDTNIFIDLEEGNLLNEFLPYRTRLQYLISSPMRSWPLHIATYYIAVYKY